MSQTAGEGSSVRLTYKTVK